MNGDFTQWDLYLASSSEYAMRLIDGFISMLESRNLVCVAQLLRAQVGVCLRTFALFAAEDQDDFLPKGCQVPWRERWGSHHSAWIHPDAHRSRRFQRSRISRAGNRRGQATPYSCRRRSRLCRGFLPQASSAHPESPPGLRPRHRCAVSHFSCSSFGTRFTMSSGTPGQSDHVVAPFERVTSMVVPFSELVSTSTVPP